MVATPVLGTGGEIRVGSSPTWGTKIVDSISKVIYNSNNARVVELVYTQDLKSCAVWIEGSSPSSRTKN